MLTSGGACHGAWTNAFRLSQCLAKVPEGAVRHPPVFQACASIGVRPAQSLSSLADIVASLMEQQMLYIMTLF